jgi:hypothetical protein
VLIVDGLGVPVLPGTTETFLYVGVDGTCLPGVDQGVDQGGQPVGPQSVQNYIWPGGSHALSFHLGQPDCKAKAAYPDVTVALDAGRRAFLFLSSPDGKSLKALQVPIE